VIGDVMVDQYISGAVHRISPEAPVPVLLHQDTIHLPGGAANVALNLAGMDNEVWLASVIGTDSMGNILKGLLAEKNIHMELILADEHRMTTCKTRVMAGKQHLLRMDQEITEDLSPQTLGNLLANINTLLEAVEIDIVVLQDYNKGVLNTASIQQILQLMQKHQIPVAVDPKFQNFYTYQGVTIFKPNLTELKANVPFEVEITESGLTKAAAHLRAKLGCHLVLITLSDRGIFIDDGIHHLLIPAERRLITDVCGAGDTVISVASIAYAGGLQLTDIAYWAGRCGTIVCQYPGVVPISREMVLTSD
jgi:rfaE bifunctional protein kinase chain/domain